MLEAERANICFEQRHYFRYEFTYLEHGKTLSSRSTIHKLDPILDNGILRVGGRINKSAMPMHQKNPIIPLKGAHISTSSNNISIIKLGTHEEAICFPGQVKGFGSLMQTPQPGKLSETVYFAGACRQDLENRKWFVVVCVQTYLLLVILTLTTLIPLK